MNRPNSQHAIAPYKKLKLQGKGSFGKAYLVEKISDKSLQVLKQIDCKDMTEAEIRETYKEAEILKGFDHPYITKVRDVCRTKSNKLWIVMDYADGGDLEKKLKQLDNKDQQFSEQQIIQYFTQLCLAVKHIHDRKIIHRDLKSQNVFLTSKNEIKLGDFGIAKVLNKTQEVAKTMVGTPYYLSPEIINAEEYSFATDIWSLGVILYEMCCQKPPFSGQSLNALAKKIVKGNYDPIPERYTNALQSLIDSQLVTPSHKRPTIHKLLENPIIKNTTQNLLSKEQYHKEFCHTVLHNQNIVNVNKSNLIKNYNKLKMIDIENPNTQMIIDQRNINNEEKSQLFNQQQNLNQPITPHHTKLPNLNSGKPNTPKPISNSSYVSKRSGFQKGNNIIDDIECKGKKINELLENQNFALNLPLGYLQKSNINKSNYPCTPIPKQNSCKQSTPKVNNMYCNGLRAASPNLAKLNLKSIGQCYKPTEIKKEGISSFKINNNNKKIDLQKRGSDSIYSDELHHRDEAKKMIKENTDKHLQCNYQNGGKLIRQRVLTGKSTKTSTDQPELGNLDSHEIDQVLDRKDQEFQRFKKRNANSRQKTRSGTDQNIFKVEFEGNLDNKTNSKLDKCNIPTGKRDWKPTGIPHNMSNTKDLGGSMSYIFPSSDDSKTSENLHELSIVGIKKSYDQSTKDLFDSKVIHKVEKHNLKLGSNNSSPTKTDNCYKQQQITSPLLKLKPEFQICKNFSSPPDLMHKQDFFQNEISLSKYYSNKDIIDSKDTETMFMKKTSPELAINDNNTTINSKTCLSNSNELEPIHTQEINEESVETSTHQKTSEHNEIANESHVTNYNTESNTNKHDITGLSYKPKSEKHTETDKSLEKKPIILSSRQSKSNVSENRKYIKIIKKKENSSKDGSQADKNDEIAKQKSKDSIENDTISKTDEKLSKSEVISKRSIRIVTNKKISPDKSFVNKNTQKLSRKNTVDSDDDMFNYTKTVTHALTNINITRREGNSDEISYLNSIKKAPETTDQYTLTNTIPNNSDQFDKTDKKPKDNTTQFNGTATKLQNNNTEWFDQTDLKLQNNSDQLGKTDFNGLERITLNFTKKVDKTKSDQNTKEINMNNTKEINMNSNISMNQYKFKRTKFQAKNDKNCESLKKDIKNNIEEINAKFNIDESSDCFFDAESTTRSGKETKMISRSSLTAQKNSSSPKFVENAQNSNELQKLDLAEQNFDLTEHNFDLTEHEFADIKTQTTKYSKKKDSQDAVSEFISESAKKTHKSSDVEDEAFKVTINVRPEELKGIKEDDPVYLVSDFAQLEDKKQQLENKIGDEFFEIYEKLNNILQDDQDSNLEELKNDADMLLQKMGYPTNSFSVKTKGYIKKLFKLVIIERIAEESEHHNSKRML